MSYGVAYKVQRDFKIPAKIFDTFAGYHDRFNYLSEKANDLDTMTANEYIEWTQLQD